MSAGGLSYSMLTTNRRVTLPSVEMWGTNMNILADPPSGKFTRRIDKVGDTQGVLLSQESSGDRIAEAINVYARGVNPMVSVSYDNNSNNAGAPGTIKNIGQARLPYKPEVFHPPSFRQEDLMPLSRQPRNWFYALTNPVVPNIVSQMSCPDGRSAIHTDKRSPEPVVTNLQYNLVSTERQHNIDLFHQINQIEKNPQRKYQTTAIHDGVNNSAQFSKIDPKHLADIRQFDRSSGVAKPSAGGHADMIVARDKGSTRENTLLYSALSNISGNKNLFTQRDMTQKLQNKAIQEYYQTVDVQSSNQGPYIKDGSSSTDPRGKVLDNVLHTELAQGTNAGYTRDGESHFHGDRNIIKEARFGSWVSSTESRPHLGAETYMSNAPQEASNPILKTEYQTTPSSTNFWKTVEPLVETKTNTRDILAKEAPARRTMTGVQNTIHSDKLNHELRRSTPLTSGESGFVSNYTKNVEVDSLGSGKIDPTFQHLEHYTQKSQNIHTSPVETNSDVPVRVRENPFHVEANSFIGTTSMGQRHGLDAYQHSKQRSAIDTLYQSHNAETSKKYYEQQGELGYRENNPRTSLLVENMETVHDRSSFGQHLYRDAQSTDGSSYVNALPASSGSFEALGNSVPRFDRTHNSGSENPVTEKFLEIKKKAVSEFSDRYQNNRFPQ